MDLLLTNPLGLLALLGIPAVLAIHFLQRQSREALISTRFLLEPMQKESVSGEKIDRLRSSIPLWLQLLLVLLLAWLLVAPRWQNKTSVQRTAIVLDSSASMQAFQEELPALLEPVLNELAGRAARADFVVLDSRLGNDNLYHGPSHSELLTAIASWKPRQGQHDLTPALQVAHSLVGRDGTVLLVSDQDHLDLPFGARLLAIGRPIPNGGFTGLQITHDETGEARWRVLLRNYGDQPANRSWHLEVAGQPSPPRSVTIDAGRAIVLEGSFPGGVSACTLHLDPDEFPFDDTIPIVRSAPKILYVEAAVAPAYQSLYPKLLESLQSVQPADADNPADLVFATYDPTDPGFPENNAVVAVTQRHQEARALQGDLTAAPHELMDGLNWQSLLCRSTLGIPAREGDEVLLWQGRRALIFLRRTTGTRQLLFNFDLTASNAVRLPATVVLLHRFVETLRREKIATETANTETGQPLLLAADTGPDAPPLILDSTPVDTTPASRQTIPPDNITTLHAPLDPGFFRISQGENQLFIGAAHFADPRESDFRGATSSSDLDDLTPALIQRHTREDPWWRIWILLAGAVLLLNWYFTGRTPTGSRASAPLR